MMDYGQFEYNLEKFVEYCRTHLDFSIPDLGYYSCLPLCALNSVYLRGTGFSRVSKSVDRFCKRFDIPRDAENPRRVPPSVKQKTVHQVLEMLSDISPKELADIICNGKASYSKYNVLKATNYIRWLDILELYGIQTFQDFQKNSEKLNLEQDLVSLCPKHNGIITYSFYLLAGSLGEVKVDNHILSFCRLATDEDHISATIAKKLFKEAVKELIPDYPDLSVRRLNHLVWMNQLLLTK